MIASKTSSPPFSRTPQVIQMLSNGSIRLIPDSTSKPENEAGAPLPGCAEDGEVSRTITGQAVIRTLVSGRIEVLHADGTSACRSPTAEELQTRLEESPCRSQQGCCDDAAKRELLTKMLQAYKDAAADEPRFCPGQWVIIRSDGHVFRRDEDGEHEVDSVATALQVDLFTQHRALTNSRGFASFEDPEGVQKVCVYPDGTRITSTVKEFGTETEIFKEGMALVRCEIPAGEGGLGSSKM